MPTSTCTPDQITWSPDPEIDIGPGNNYSDKLLSSQMVCDLLASDNNCIKQTINNL